jgi:predicted RND superfamily exporter protein
MDRFQQFLESKPYIGDTWSIVDFLKQMNKAMHADDPTFEKLPESRNLVFQYLLLYSMGGDPEDFDNVVDYEYRMAVIQVFLHDYSTHTAKKLIREARKYVAQNFPPGYKIGIASGSSSVSAALNEVMVRGQVWNIIQVSIVVFILCALVFRSLVGGLLTLIPLVFAVLINFGVMGWTGIWLSIGTSTIAAMGIGIGVDYAIYILSRFREEWQVTGDIHQSLVRTMTTSGKAVVFTALSISLGYCTLLFSQIIYHMHIGFLVALIMISSLLGAVTLLPALIVWIQPGFIFGNKKLSLEQGGSKHVPRKK